MDEKSSKENYKCKSTRKTQMIINEHIAHLQKKRKKTRDKTRNNLQLPRNVVA